MYRLIIPGQPARIVINHHHASKFIKTPYEAAYSRLECLYRL